MLNAPLEDAELDELQQIMMSWPAEDALEVSGLHGLLTAVVSSPETVMPSEWLPVVLGSYVFETQAEAQRVITLIMRFMNEIVDTLINEQRRTSRFCWNRSELDRHRRSLARGVTAISRASSSVPRLGSRSWTKRESDTRSKRSFG